MKRVSDLINSFHDPLDLENYINETITESSGNDDNDIIFSAGILNSLCILIK